MFITKVDYGTPAYAETVSLRQQELGERINLEITTDELAEEYKDGHIAMYDTNFYLIGCAVLKATAKATVADMQQVSIRKPYQKKGYGKTLVSKIEAHARANGFRFVQTQAYAAVAPFYEALGYKRVGRPKNILGIKRYKVRKRIVAK